MNRSITALAALAFGAAALTGCSESSSDSSGNSAGSAGGSSSSEYCAAVAEMGGVSAAPGTDSADLVAKSRAVAAVAPGEIKSDWETYADSMERMHELQPDPSDPAAAAGNLAEMEQVSGDLTESAGKVSSHVEANCQ